MLMIRSWNRWVWSTHPRLTLTPAPRATRSASGSQYVSHHTPRPMPAPSERNHRARLGVPAAPRANHGAASISTNVSASSLRQTKELHSGCSDTLPRPTSAHLAAVVTTHATSPATSTTGPASSTAPSTPHRSRHASSASSTPTPSPTVQITGTSRRTSTAPRATRSRARRPERAGLVRDRGGTAQRHRRGTEPRASRLGPFRCRREDRDEPPLGHRATWRRHAGVAEEGPLAHLGPLDPHPPAAQLVGAHHRVVGEERAVAHRRHPRQHQHGRRLDVAPHPRAERPEPHRRDQARVEREQQRAGVVQKPLGGPDLPAGAAAHGVGALREAGAEGPHADQCQRRQDGERGHRAQRQPAGRTGRGLREGRVPPTPAQTTSRPHPAATSG